MRTSLIILLSLLSFNGNAKKIYTITKNDFIRHFKTEKPTLNIECFNESGEKVFLRCNTNTILTFLMMNGKDEEVILYTVHRSENIVEATKYNVWIPVDKKIKINLDSAVSIHIKANFQESENQYFDIESLKQLTKLKNDSLSNECLNREYNEIIFSPEKPKGNVFKISENACYNLQFNDNKTTNFGIVLKIAHDSIYITNFLDKEMSKANKSQFEIFKYPIKEISMLHLLKSGGYTYNKIDLKNISWKVTKIDTQKNGCPIWYALNTSTGKINFYRSWLTDSGFKGITAIDGRAIWYEGEWAR